MTCKDVKEMIPLYYYGEMEDDRAGAVRVHLASCADCRKELALVSGLLEKVTVPEVPELPDKFWSRSAADIMRHVRPPRHAVPLWTAAAAAAAAVILFLLISGMNLESRKDPTVVKIPEVVSVSDDIVETEFEMEYLKIEIGDFWVAGSVETFDEPSGGFDSEFTEALDMIEISMEGLLMEFEAADPGGGGVNGSA